MTTKEQLSASPIIKIAGWLGASIVLSTLLYAIAYRFESGFAMELGVPVDLVVVSLESTLRAALAEVEVSGVAFGPIAIAVFPWAAWNRTQKWARTARVSFCIGLSTITAIVYAGSLHWALLQDFGGLSPHAFISNLSPQPLAEIVTIGIVTLLTCVIVWKRTRFVPVKDNQQSRALAAIALATFAFLTPVALAKPLGAATAKQQTAFLVLREGASDYVLLRTWGDIAVGAELSRESRTYGPDYLIWETKTSPHLRMENLGSLRPASQTAAATLPVTGDRTHSLTP